MSDNKKFKPTSIWMAENYAKLNNELFNGELGECILRPFTSGKGSQGGTLGWFKITASNVRIERTSRKMFVTNWYGSNREYINYENFFDLCSPCIELNANYSWSEHAMLATLAHEMCHYYTYMRGYAPKQGHGAEFYAIGDVVSQRSNGVFTIQRLASAEQMSEMELAPEIQAKKDKRLANKKAKINAIFVYNDTGTVELSMTSSDKVIQEIVKSCTTEPRFKQSERGLADKIIKCNDADFIDILFGKGYKKNFRTYRYWDSPTIAALGKDVLNYPYDTLYDKSNQSLSQSKKEQTSQPKNIVKHLKRYFVLKLSGGGEIRVLGTDYNVIKNALLERFPNMSDESIRKVIYNQANYQLMEEGKTNINKIIKETLSNFLNKEFNTDDSIAIDPNMNLGIESPLENIY